MALGTGHFTDTDLDVMIPEIWGQRLNDFFKEQLIMASFFTDRSEELVGGGDVLHTPNITEMSANTKSNGSQVTLNSPTETKIDLTVDTWEEVSFLIEDREAAQVKQSYQIQMTYAQNAAFTMASQLEEAIAALFSGFSTGVGASTTNILDSDIRAAIATLETAKVPGIYAGQVAFFFHPNTFWRQLQGIDRFALAQNSPVNDPSGKKPAATLYGIPVFVSPNVPNVSGSTGRYNLLGHKDAIHWARLALAATGKSQVVGSEGVRLQTHYIAEYLGFLTTADLLYGVIENRDNAAVKMLTHATAA